MFDIGSGELLLILVAVLVFFGPKKLPELARSVGRGVREFKRAQREFTDQINQAFSDEESRQRGNIPRRTASRIEPPRVEIHEGDQHAPAMVVPAHPMSDTPLSDVPLAPPDFTEGATDPDTSPEPAASSTALHAPEATVAQSMTPTGPSNPDDDKTGDAESGSAERQASTAESAARTVGTSDGRRERENREA